MTPEQLLQQARSGDRKALEALLAAEQSRIYGFGMRMCRNPDDASDILQETMLAMAKTVGSFRGESSLSTWMFQIARSFCIKKRRRKKGEPSVTESVHDEDAPQIASAQPSPEEQVQGKEREQQLQDALGKLPLPAREVLVLRDVEGLTAPEVAEVLGISVDAVKSRLHRARAALEAQLRPLLDVPRGEAAPGECPDILAMASRKLEGELTQHSCAEMEKHVERCPRCRGACDALKHSLALCKQLPEVPDDVSRQVRTALHQFLQLPR